MIITSIVYSNLVCSVRN